MPGTLVCRARNGPRIPSGASGLGSNVSKWLGPPHIQKRMTAVSGGAAGRAASSWQGQPAERERARPQERPPREGVLVLHAAFISGKAGDGQSGRAVVTPTCSPRREEPH